MHTGGGGCTAAPLPGAFAGFSKPLIGPKVCRFLASLPPSFPRFVFTYLFSLLGLGWSSLWAPLTPFLNPRNPGESLSHPDLLALPLMPAQMWALSDMMR